MSCCIAVLCVPPLYFPMWGGMFLPAKKGVTEEDYYYSEYTEAEREQGLHLASSHFVRLACLPDNTTSLLIVEGYIRMQLMDVAFWLSCKQGPDGQSVSRPSQP